MKKHIAALGLLLLFSITTQSQVLISLLLGDSLNSDKLEFGMETGINFSSISGMESSDRKAFFNIGFYFDFKLKNPQWSVYTGVLVKANQGLNNLTTNDLAFLETQLQEEEGTYSQRLNTFLVPALIKYGFNSGIYVEGGMQFGLVTKAYVEFNSDVDGLEVRTRESNRDQINRIDAGLLGGLGFRFKKGKRITVGAKYYYGLVDVYKSRTGTKNSTFFLKANFTVGAKKAKEKAAEKAKIEAEKEDVEKLKTIEETEKK